MTSTMEEADPVREVHSHLEQTVRVAMAGALQVAYVRSEKELRAHDEASRTTDQTDRDLARRRAGNEAVARALWTRTGRPEWWERANPEQVARAYEAARTYAEKDPGAADALVAMDREINSRYGLTVDKETGAAMSTTDAPLDHHAVVAEMPAADQAQERAAELTERWQAAVGEEVSAEMVRSPAWPALEQRLTELDRSGVDSARVLADAAQWRNLDDAGDVAKVLHWRLSPAAGKSKDKGLGVERTGLGRARTVSETIDAGKAPPSPRRPSGPDPATVDKSVARARRRTARGPGASSER